MRKVTLTFETSRPTWVRSRTSSLTNQKTVHATKSIDPRAQPLLPQHTREMSAHVVMVLVGVSLLDTKTDAESPVDIFLSTSQKRSKTHVVTKSLYIKTWFVLNKFECLKNVETFQGPKHVL